MDPFPTLEKCFSAAESFARARRPRFTDAEYVGKLVYLFRLEWDRRFAKLLADRDASMEDMPSIEDQVWDCSVPIAEIVDPTQDPIDVYFCLMEFLKSDSARGVLPIHYESSADRDLIRYG
jgi:hypothetical protein